MAATARQEREMVTKYTKAMNNPDLKPLERLRAYALSKGVRGIKTLATIFKTLDKNKDRKIDYDEFVNGLHADGIYAEDDECRDCFDDMDTDHTGIISFDEFLVALRPPMSKRRRELIRMAFNKLDRTKNGLVNAEDLKGVYSAAKHPKYISGEMTETDVFREFLNSFNGPDRTDGVVEYEDFENYYVGVSASIDSDVYFDLMMRQAWKL